MLRISTGDAGACLPMISYEGKVVLAPMVRIGTLPMRLLALDYGADLVWSPETIDKKLISSVRNINTKLGTIDYVTQGPRPSLVMRIHPRERERLILQLGSADPLLAVQAVKEISEDVAGIDLNCGCPKHFSVHAGMGAALLRTPNTLCNILRSLVIAYPHKCISAKIRLLPDKEETLSLVKSIAETGIRALTVHCRTPAERPRNPAHYEWLSDIAKLCPFPVIANGDIFSSSDMVQFQQFGVKSFMIARAAQWNVSIFRAEGMLPPFEVSQEYLRYAMNTDNPFSNTKYTIMQMWIDRPYSDKRFTAKIQKATTINQLCEVFNLECQSSLLATEFACSEDEEITSKGSNL